MVKEIIYPLGAEIDVRAVRVGDETLSVMEIWGAEYQVRMQLVPPHYAPPLAALRLTLPPSLCPRSPHPPVSLSFSPPYCACRLS